MKYALTSKGLFTNCPLCDKVILIEGQDIDTIRRIVEHGYEIVCSECNAVEFGNQFDDMEASDEVSR